jgi:hypothetical protein
VSSVHGTVSPDGRPPAVLRVRNARAASGLEPSSRDALPARSGSRRGPAGRTARAPARPRAADRARAGLKNNSNNHAKNISLDKL